MQNLSLSKKIILAIVFVLIVVIVGLFWNIGRNQKPSQKLVDELTSLVNNSQSSVSNSEPNFADLVNIAQSKESSNNSNTNQTFPESQLISNSSSFSAFSNSQFPISTNNLQANSNVDFEIPNTNGQNSQSFSSIEIPSFRNSQSSTPNYDSGWILSEKIKGEIQNYKIDTFGQNEIYKIPTSRFDDEPLILINLIQYPIQNLEENLYLYNVESKKMAMFGSEIESIVQAGNNGEYRLVLATDNAGYKKLFWTNNRFENPKEIEIDQNLKTEVLSKVSKIDGKIVIETNSYGRNSVIKKYNLNMNKILENKSDFLENVN